MCTCAGAWGLEGALKLLTDQMEDIHTLASSSYVLAVRVALALS